MATSDLEEVSVQILKDNIPVTALGPTVHHILLGGKYYFYLQN